MFTGGRLKLKPWPEQQTAAILASEHGIGLGVVDERLGGRVNVKLATQPVRDVAQVAMALERWPSSMSAFKSL